MTTTDDVIRLAAEAGFEDAIEVQGWPPEVKGTLVWTTDEIARLIALAKAEEREACIATIEQLEHGNVTTCAAAIRARDKEQA